MINLGTSIKNKRDPFKLNPFYLDLDTCCTFNQKINKNTIRYIQKVVRGVKSQNNVGVNRINHKGNYGVFLGYLKTWFHPNGMGDILSFSAVEK